MHENLCSVISDLVWGKHENNSRQHAPEISSTLVQNLVNILGIFCRFLRPPFLISSTCFKNLVNKLMFFVNIPCMRNVQNMSKKKRGKSLFFKPLPRISLIISILSFILLQQPARPPNNADNQSNKSLLQTFCKLLNTRPARSAQ